MERMSILAVVATVALFSAAPAPADEPGLRLDQNCRTTLSEDTTKEPSVMKPDADSTLSKSLTECKGVLRPPVVGDDMAVPPPRNGAKTPVLLPGSVPEQTPKR